MKLLFDQNLSPKLCGFLADLFPSSSHVSLVGLNRADDLTVRSFASSHGFAIVTKDADFADLAIHFGAPPKVIWLRCGNQPTRIAEGLLREHVAAILAFDADPAATCIEIY